MAGRTEYIVAHPNNEDHIRVRKSGKAPTFAIWAEMNGTWEQVGFSYQGSKMDATTKSQAHKLGYRTRATRMLPTR